MTEHAVGVRARARNEPRHAGSEHLPAGQSSQQYKLICHYWCQVGCIALGPRLSPCRIYCCSPSCPGKTVFISASCRVCSSCLVSCCMQKQHLWPTLVSCKARVNCRSCCQQQAGRQVHTTIQWSHLQTPEANKKYFKLLPACIGVCLRQRSMTDASFGLVMMLELNTKTLLT